MTGKLRNQSEIMARRALRRTFRFLHRAHHVRHLKPAQQTKWRQTIVSFYMSREHADDLPEDAIDGNRLNCEPLCSLPLIAFHLDYMRLSRVRRQAVALRLKWSPADRAKWIEMRTDAEADDDARFGFDLLHFHAQEVEPGASCCGQPPGQPFEEEQGESPTSSRTHSDEDDVWTSSWWHEPSTWTADWAASSSWDSPSKGSQWEPTWSTTEPSCPAAAPAATMSSEPRGGVHGGCAGPPTHVPNFLDIVVHLKALQDAHLLPMPREASWFAEPRDLPSKPHFKPRQQTGRFVWDMLANKAEPHIRRQRGRGPVERVQGKKCDVYKKWGWAGLGLVPGQVQSFSYATDLVMSWMAHRPQLKDVFDSMRLVNLLEDFDINMWNLPGCWLYFPRKGRPQPKKDKLSSERRWGYHGTSMYCVSRIFLLDSLHTGMAKLTRGDAELRGIYYHSAERAHLCQGTYMHYICMGAGFFVAPLVVRDAALQSTLADGTPIRSVAHTKNKNTTQYITHENFHRLDGLLIHVIHASQALRMPADQLLAAEPSWQPGLELCHHDTWEEIIERSRELQNVELQD